MILLALFTAAFAYAHFKNGINDCGCFGMFDLKQQSPIFTFIRNVLLFGMSLFIFLTISKENWLIENWKKYSIIAFFIPAIFVCGYTFHIPQSFYKLKQHPCLNKPIKETELSNYLRTSLDSSYLIYCFSYSCPHCLNSIENYEGLKKRGIVDSIIAISLVSADTSLYFKDRDDFMEFFGTDFVSHELSTEKEKSIIRRVPTSFYIERDTIKRIIESELPSPFIFQKFIKSKH